MVDELWPVWWLAVPGAVALLALMVFLGAIGAIARRRPLSAFTGLLVAVAIAGAAVAILLLGTNIQTYRRLAWEHPVAVIDVHRTGERSFEATLTEVPAQPEFGQAPAAPPPQTYPLLGDEWRLEARMLKWKPWANLLGLDSRYRLERLAGEFTDTATEQAGPHSVVDLRRPAEEGQLWKLTNRLNRAHLIDTVYGSAAIMPAADGARYELSMTQSGLVARPANDVAKQAIGAVP